MGQIAAAGTDCLGNDRSPRDNIILMSAKKAFTGCRLAIAKSGWVSLLRHSRSLIVSKSQGEKRGKSFAGCRQLDAADQVKWTREAGPLEAVSWLEARPLDFIADIVSRSAARIGAFIVSPSSPKYLRQCVRRALRASRISPPRTSSMDRHSGERPEPMTAGSRINQMP